MASAFSAGSNRDLVVERVAWVNGLTKDQTTGGCCNGSAGPNELEYRKQRVRNQAIKASKARDKRGNKKRREKELDVAG